MDDSADDAAADVKRRRPRRRGVRRWIRPLLLVLITAHIAYGAWYAVCKAELDAEIARIRARGEPLTLTELAPDEDGAHRIVGLEEQMRLLSDQVYELADRQEFLTRLLEASPSASISAKPED